MPSQKRARARRKNIYAGLLSLSLLVFQRGWLKITTPPPPEASIKNREIARYCLA